MSDWKTTHGMRDSSEYIVWGNIKQRCHNPQNNNYPYYGGRGIVLCERWHDFALFYADMGPRPKGHTIDRTDNDGSYEPGNCAWVTRKRQQNNRRNNVMMTHAGETMTMGEWADRTGIPYKTLQSRLRLGWDHGRALSEPRRKRVSRVGI